MSPGERRARRGGCRAAGLPLPIGAGSVARSACPQYTPPTATFEAGPSPSPPEKPPLKKGEVCPERGDRLPPTALMMSGVRENWVLIEADGPDGRRDCEIHHQRRRHAGGPDPLVGRHLRDELKIGNHDSENQ